MNKKIIIVIVIAGTGISIYGYGQIQSSPYYIGCPTGTIALQDGCHSYAPLLSNQGVPCVYGLVVYNTQCISQQAVYPKH